MRVDRRCAAVVAVATMGLMATAPGAQAGHGGDMDCSDFADQESAQRHMDAHPGDPDGLDGSDGDGRACESNPCPCSSATGGSDGSGQSRPLPVRRYRARVVDVVDGDTLRVRLRSGRRRTVRLIGIDTPETRKPGVAVECGAREATARMRRLAPTRRGGVRVRLVTDPSQDRTDSYGRLLAYAHRRRDGRDLGRAMVRAGWATTYVHDGRPFRRLPAYSRARRAAEAAGRGVFGRCGGDFHSEQ